MELDNLLWYLISRLEKKDLLRWINLVIVSDHGMQKLKFTPYISDMISDQNILVTHGVIGRLHKHKSALTMKQLMRPFECKQGDKWKVYDRRSMATRKHHQKTPRVGDVIVQGQPGTRFYENPSKNWKLTGDHGYDYINSAMHAIFYAMGPSIKKGSFLPAFQNIEYMNLWLNLLGLPENVPNNGTLGIMDKIFVHGPFRPTPDYVHMLECMAVNPIRAYGCHSCSSEDLDLTDVSFDLRIFVPVDVLEPLNAYTQSLVERMGKLFSVTGAAYDFDYDGIADKKTRSVPSHLYRVLISCLGAWSSDGTFCSNPSETIVLSFIFPHIEKDINCLASKDLLLDYTARLLDVELISGMRIQFPNL